MDEPISAERGMTGPDELTAPHGVARGSAWGSLGVWAMLSAAFAAAFANNFYEMWLRWYPAWKHADWSLYDRLLKGTSYYSHGALVPLVSLFIFFLLVRKTKVPVRPRPALGFLVLGLSVLAHLMSCLARVNFASSFAMIGVLAGLVLILWGAQALRRLWFPLAFLAFMVPLPEVSIARLNFRLKMFSSDIGVRLANAVGIIVERSGNRVFIAGDSLGAEHKQLVIANVCNGLRTLITVIGFGALYTYVCRARGWRRLLLFAMSVPVALVANSIRILGLIAVADIWDEQTATGTFHDVSGAMIFVLAFLMMFGIERVLLWRPGVPKRREEEQEALFANVRRDPEDERQGRRLFLAAGTMRAGVAVMVLAVTAAGAMWLNRTEPASTDSGTVSRAIPLALNVGGVAWTGYDVPLDEMTLIILETPDYVNRRYVCPGPTPPVDVSIIFSKDNRKGTHPPDLCLEGAGGGIVAKGTFTVDEVPGPGQIECAEIVVQSGSTRRYFLYFYKCGDAYTASFWRQQLVIFTNGLLNRNSAGALIRVSTEIEKQDVAAARERAKTFVRVTVPYFDKSLR